jgi:hypothetical protein
MNVRLFLAGALVLLAGMDSDYDRAWVVVAFGIAMVVASLLQAAVAPRQRAAQRPAEPVALHSPKRERIVRERWRESRERYWPFDRSA